MPGQCPDNDRNEAFDDDAPASLRFERRTIDRWPVHGSATAVRVGGSHFGQAHELKLNDASADGLGATCDTVLEPGTMVSVRLAEPGALFRQAVVLRCQPCGSGYRVGLQFALRAAA